MIVEELEDADLSHNTLDYELIAENRQKINQLVRVVNRFIEADPILSNSLHRLIKEHGRESL